MMNDYLCWKENLQCHSNLHDIPRHMNLPERKYCEPVSKTYTKFKQQMGAYQCQCAHQSEDPPIEFPTLQLLPVLGTSHSDYRN